MTRPTRGWLVAALLLIPLAAGANESAVKQALQKKYPKVQIENIAKTPMPGVYEIYADGEILYVDEKADHIIVGGRMIDAARKEDLTAERLRALSAVKFDQLPLDLAFRKVQGNGSRKVAYFTDPNCPYCKQFEPALNKLENVTIYVFLYPVLGRIPTTSRKRYGVPRTARARGTT